MRKSALSVVSFNSGIRSNPCRGIGGVNSGCLSFYHTTQACQTERAIPRVDKEIPENDTNEFTNTSQQRYVYKNRRYKNVMKFMAPKIILPWVSKRALDPMDPRNSTKGISEGVFPVNRRKITDEEVQDRADYWATHARGHYKKFKIDGDAGILNAPYKESDEMLRRTVMQASDITNYGENDNEYELFTYNTTNVIKPDQYFVDNMEAWRSGKWLSRHHSQFIENFTRGATILPFFERDRRPDPFRGQAHLIRRISYKNADFLQNFLSATGRILNRRTSGVSGKAQRRIKQEVKKARFLGLIPFTANPGFYESVEDARRIGLTDVTGGSSTTEEGRASMDDEKYIEQNDRFDRLFSFVYSLRRKIAPEAHLVWNPPKGVTNPRINDKEIEKEYLGTLPEQMELKKKKLKQLLLENMLLDEFKHDIVSERIEDLRRVLKHKEDMKRRKDEETESDEDFNDDEL